MVTTDGSTGTGGSTTQPLRMTLPPGSPLIGSKDSRTGLVLAAGSRVALCPVCGTVQLEGSWDAQGGCSNPECPLGPLAATAVRYEDPTLTYPYNKPSDTPRIVTPPVDVPLPPKTIEAPPVDLGGSVLGDVVEKLKEAPGIPPVPPVEKPKPASPVTPLVTPEITEPDIPTPVRPVIQPTAELTEPPVPKPVPPTTPPVRPPAFEEVFTDTPTPVQPLIIPTPPVTQPTTKPVPPTTPPARPPAFEDAFPETPTPVQPLIVPTPPVTQPTTKPVPPTTPPVRPPAFEDAFPETPTPVQPLIVPTPPVTQPTTKPVPPTTPPVRPPAFETAFSDAPSKPFQPTPWTKKTPTDEETPLPSVTGKTSGEKCAGCGESLLASDEIYTCSRCGTKHHRDCWEARQGCAIPHCASKIALEQTTTSSAPIPKTARFLDEDLSIADIPGKAGKQSPGILSNKKLWIGVCVVLVVTVLIVIALNVFFAPPKEETKGSVTVTTSDGKTTPVTSDTTTTEPGTPTETQDDSDPSTSSKPSHGIMPPITPVKPPVVTTPPSNTAPTLSPLEESDIKRGLAKVQQDSQIRYNSMVKKKKDLAGSIMVSFTVKADGTITGLTVNSNTMNDKDMGQQLQSLVLSGIRGTRFRASLKGRTTSFTFSFSPRL